jgi:hypothetical protein
VSDAAANAACLRQLVCRCCRSSCVQPGTFLGDSCLPTTFQHFFYTLAAAVPTVGRPITLQLVSKTPFAAVAAANGSWQVTLQSFAGAPSVLLGSMQQWQNTSTDIIWRFVVPGSVISTVTAKASMHKCLHLLAASLLALVCRH